MRTFVALVSVLLLLLVLQDGFETIVLPRRVTRRFRFTRFFYRMTWMPWSSLARGMSSSKRRETFLGYFGPLSLILLLCVWAVGLIMGFAMLQWALESPLYSPDRSISFGSYAYMSGTTFFTLGFGDVTPAAPLGRILADSEAGMGFGFLALIIG